MIILLDTSHIPNTLVNKCIRAHYPVTYELRLTDEDTRLFMRQTIRLIFTELERTARVRIISLDGYTPLDIQLNPSDPSPGAPT